MHDTHLIEKIYQSIASLCRESGIVKVSEVTMEVDEGSHMDGSHLLSHLMDRDGAMFGPWTVVHVEQKPYEALTAVIRSIHGEG